MLDFLCPNTHASFSGMAAFPSLACSCRSYSLGFLTPGEQNQGKARLRVSLRAVCVLMASIAVLLTLLTCVTQGWGEFLWRKTFCSVLCVLQDVPLLLLHQCNSSAPVSPSAGVKSPATQQEQTFLSPSPVVLCSLRIGLCFSVGREDICVWDEQGI